jgi:two-component system sensor histidine kinase VicK
MSKGLHMKLVIIMLLLIVSLLTVVCAFLIRGVMGFYIQSFYDQMNDEFQSEEFYISLRDAADDDNGVNRIKEIMDAHKGLLGIDNDNRNYYILDGSTGHLLAASDGSNDIDITPNIVTAINGGQGDKNDSSAEYMDVAVPLNGRDNSYIIYIRDNKKTVQDLKMELFLIILYALAVGLVISVLLSFLLSKTMVIPIQSLTRAANRVAAGDFSERIDVQARDEIGVLTTTFNNMAGKLQTTLLDIENERNKLATVFLHMTDGIVAFSAGGKIIHFNPAAEKMLDMNLASAGLDFEDIFGGIIDLAKVLALKNDEVIEGERDINSRALEVFITPFYGEAAVGGILAVIHDITVQKKSEEMRREFVANVSHELKTPITNVRSYAETLSDYGSDISEEKRIKYLGVILSESDRMDKIVQDLLVLSKFDAGETEFNMEVFDATEAARNIYEAMRLDISKHGLELSLSLPAKAAMIEGDKARIEQVIVNIISNAVRYTAKGGIDISVETPPNEVHIVVKDTGCGIPKKDIPRIFERFYRVDKARSRAMGGTGLGLSIAYEIVRRHNGRIDIDSEGIEGKGTTVTVCLPSVKGKTLKSEG